MKVLQLLNAIFKDAQVQLSVKEEFQHQREIRGDDRAFFEMVIQYLGGRGYNEYLDYSLFAVKLAKIFSDSSVNSVPGANGLSPQDEAVISLLYDDRHDLWQNLPYSLASIANDMEDPEEQKQFYTNVVSAMIECINVSGTGNVAHKFHIKEK